MNKENLKKITKLRHLLHQHPNLSGQEGETIDILHSFLLENTSLEITDRGEWFYVFKAGKREGTPIAFRADMDALPMEDILDLPYTSVNRGISHRCGHDGHMAALCGLALELDQIELERPVYLIFQPAEETGKGAILCKELIQEKGITEIYAFHNLSGYPEGSIVFRRGLTQPASEGLKIQMYGKPSHASAPEEGHNPAQAIARLALYSEAFAKELATWSDSMLLCTMVGMNCGEGDYGISPGVGYIAFTLRAEKENMMKRLESGLLDYAHEMADEYGLSLEYGREDYFPETRNHDSAIDLVLRQAEANGVPSIPMKKLWRASEDFGYYMKECPGAMFYIGNGEEYPPVHTQNYDFNDHILETAADLFLGLALQNPDDISH